MREERYIMESDDPYKVLAWLLVANSTPAETLRMLEDNEYVANLVRKETRLADIGGWFLDCIIEDILAKKNRMQYMHELDKLGKYFFSQLDLARLRSEIKLALYEAGLIDSR